MARPEGYRKAVRLMEMADRFDIPVLSLVDTAGAYPGIGAEERGQAEAIARSTEACLQLGVPNVAVIIGEGGSGGAIAIATANRVLMLEHAIYSVISPEGARLDPVARHHQGAGSRHQHEDHRAGPAALRHHRRHHHRAGRRRAPRSRRDRSPPPATRSPRRFDELSGLDRGHRPPAAPREVPRYRPQLGLDRAWFALPNLQAGMATTLTAIVRSGSLRQIIESAASLSAGYGHNFTVRSPYAMLNRRSPSVCGRAA